ncbi:MAG: hypothetical protein IJH14_02845 [Solobacterium sp.]|nr:hypothetical protein [Solobacterium sp.]
MTGSRRNQTIDFLKLLFSFCIIGVHINLFQDVSTPLYRLFTQSLFRIGVPFYFITSGYYYAGKLDDEAAAKAWLRKLLKLYLIFEVLDIALVLPAMGFRFPVSYVVLRFFTTGLNRINWYLISLILTCFLLRRPWQKGYALPLALLGLVLYLAAMTFDSRSFLFAGTFMQNIGELHNQIWAWPQAGFSESVLFLSLGVLLRQKNVRVRNTHLWLLLSLALLMAEGWHCQSHGAADANCYLSLLPAAVFLFLFALENPRLLPASFDSRLSLYIYMVHIYYSYVSAVFTSATPLRFMIIACLSLITAVLFMHGHRHKTNTKQM